jgi:hypothetical protein
MRAVLLKRARSWLGCEQGASMVIVALSMAALLGVSALVIDIGALNIEKSRLQNALDAAALAGAQSLPDESAALTAAQTYFAGNGCDSGGLSVSFPDSETIRCAGTASVQTAFAMVFGIDTASTQELHATAIKTKRRMKSPFDYAIFQGEPGERLDMGGRGFTVNGGVFSNGTFRCQPGGETVITSLETVADTSPDILGCVHIGSVSTGADAVGMADMQDYFDSLKADAIAGKTFVTADSAQLSAWKNASGPFTISGNYTISGNFSPSRLCIIDGVLVVNGDFTSGAGIQINPGGALIVNGDLKWNGYNGNLPYFKGALIYATGNISAFPGGTGTTFEGPNNVYAGGGMTFGGSGIVTTGNNFFYCQSGDLTVTANCSSIYMTGILYSYQGMVSLQSHPHVYGAVIGRHIDSKPGGLSVDYPTGGLGMEVTKDACRLID